MCFCSANCILFLMKIKDVVNLYLCVIEKKKYWPKFDAFTKEVDCGCSCLFQIFCFFAFVNHPCAFVSFKFLLIIILITVTTRGRKTHSLMLWKVISRCLAAEKQRGIKHQRCSTCQRGTDLLALLFSSNIFWMRSFLA